jgi:hypothetical protein
MSSDDEDSISIGAQIAAAKVQQLKSYELLSSTDSEDQRSVDTAQVNEHDDEDEGKGDPLYHSIVRQGNNMFDDTNTDSAGAIPISDGQVLTSVTKANLATSRPTPSMITVFPTSNKTQGKFDWKYPVTARDPLTNTTIYPSIHPHNYKELALARFVLANNPDLATQPHGSKKKNWDSLTKALCI